MNNFKIAQESVDSPHDPQQKWREREAELTKLLEAIREVANSKEWSSLKESIFDGDISKLEKQLLEEALKDEPNPFKQRFLAGQLYRANLYNFDKLDTKLRTELSGIRKMLYGKEE